MLTGGAQRRFYRSRCEYSALPSRLKRNDGFQSRSRMNILPEVSALASEMNEWRHHIHAHPETAFEETATAAFVADKLRSFGLEVHTGLAKTGVVGVLRAGNKATASAIGL